MLFHLGARLLEESKGQVGEDCWLFQSPCEGGNLQDAAPSLLGPGADHLVVDVGRQPHVTVCCPTDDSAYFHEQLHQPGKERHIEAKVGCPLFCNFSQYQLRGQPSPTDFWKSTPGRIAREALTRVQPAQLVKREERPLVEDVHKVRGVLRATQEQKSKEGEKERRMERKEEKENRMGKKEEQAPNSWRRSVAVAPRK